MPQVHELHFKAVKGSLLGDPGAPGTYLGRKTAVAPADGWPLGTKSEERFPIVSEGCVVKIDQRARWMVVVDALRKGIDLEPADEATRKFIGETRAEKRAALHAPKAAAPAKPKAPAKGDEVVR